MKINNFKAFKLIKESKLTNNKAVLAAISGITSLSLIIALGGCSSNQNSNTESTPTITSEPVQTETPSETNAADTKVGMAIEEMNKGLNKLDEASKEAWDSPATKETREQVYAEFQTLLGFIFNGEEIDGVKYKDLSDEGKEKVKNFFNKLDEKINEWVPDYKEKLQDWTVEKGSKGLDLYEKAKQKLKTYKNDVIEEYNKTYQK